MITMRSLPICRLSLASFISRTTSSKRLDIAVLRVIKTSVVQVNDNNFIKMVGPRVKKLNPETSIIALSAKELCF